MLNAKDIRSDILACECEKHITLHDPLGPLGYFGSFLSVTHVCNFTHVNERDVSMRLVTLDLSAALETMPFACLCLSSIRVCHFTDVNVRVTCCTTCQQRLKRCLLLVLVSFDQNTIVRAAALAVDLFVCVT